ncbi:MAG: PKD domain-containing protein [Candidatus Nitrospinota bacterium M3_3B_026]
MRIFAKTTAALLIAALAAGCGIDQKIDEALNPPAQKERPVAKISVDSKQVKVNTQVTLDGTGSYDPQNRTLTYTWSLLEKPKGSASALSSSSDPVITFTPDKGGYYTVTLQLANDADKKSDLLTVRIDAIGTGDNHPPIAIAGDDQTVTVDYVAVLDGTGSYDVDGDDITYTWALISKPGASATDVVSYREATAYIYPDAEGEYTLRLRVSDGVDIDEDFTVVTAEKESS